MYHTASQRYSHALFLTGVERNMTDVYLKQLKAAVDIISENEELQKFLKHPVMDVTKKKKAIREILKDVVDFEVVNLIVLLIEHGRVDEIEMVYEGYKDMVYKLKGIKVAIITTAVPLREEEKKLYTDALSKKYSMKMELVNEIKPEVIGGVMLKVGDEVIDGTIRGRLKRLEKELTDHTGKVSQWD